MGHTVVPFSMKSEENLDSEYCSYFVDNVDYTGSGGVGKIRAAINIIYSFEARSKMAGLLDVPIRRILSISIFFNTRYHLRYSDRCAKQGVFLAADAA